MENHWKEAQCAREDKMNDDRKEDQFDLIRGLVLDAVLHFCHSKIRFSVLFIMIFMGLFAKNTYADTWYYNPATGHYYGLTQETTWYAAEQLANGFGGHLVTINDLAENQWVLSTFDEFEGEFIGKLWIGFYQPNNVGDWVWSSGEAITYTNWADGEPNNDLSGEWVAAMYRFNTTPENQTMGKWNDEGPYSNGDFSHYHGVIELNTCPVPEPSTMLLLGSGLMALAASRKKLIKL
jgi:hypothetical protein